MDFQPTNIRVILVRPRNPGNIGACARAMGNFGFDDLVVVNPFLPIWLETRAAPDAEAIVLKARKTATLKQALRGCRRILGTSSYAHRHLEQAILPLPEIQTYLSKIKSSDRIALVFGSERSGLSNEELSQCEAVIQIPMARPRISMNLAQAVAVVLYELARAGTHIASVTQTDSGTKQEVIESWIRLAEAARYPPGFTGPARIGRIRQAMQGIEMQPKAAHFLKSFSRWLYKKLE